MNETSLPDLRKELDSATGSASTGACCGKGGLCPGIAIFLAYAVGGGIGVITGLPWLGWAIGIPLGLVLLTGAWRWLPGRRVAPVKFDTEPIEPGRQP